MSKRPWYPLYTADFDRKTKHLQPEIVGCYIRLMNFYWDNNGQLRFVPADLCRIMGLDRRRFNATWAYLDTFFVLHNEGDGDTLLLPRLQEELEKTIAISKVKAESGKKGGLAKAKAEKQHKPTHTHTHISIDKSIEGKPSKKPEQKRLNLWDVAVSHGIPRPVIGKAIKDHGKEAVENAVKQVMTEQPADPVPFFIGVAKHGNHRQKSNGTRKQSVSDRIDQQVQAAIADAAEPPQGFDGEIVASDG